MAYDAIADSMLEAERIKLAVYSTQIEADQLRLADKIKEFQQNIEKLQQFYDKFNGEE